MADAELLALAERLQGLCLGRRLTVAGVMAREARNGFGASLAASVTGIAGPDGGSAEKPVGLTYLGLADAGMADVRRHVWTGDRAADRHESARALLRWLIERAETVSGAAAG